MAQLPPPPETDVIIRFSHAWWVYMFARGGILRVLVNGLEDMLAITGRTLLLVFLLYCGVKSGALLVNPKWTPDLWLEMGMFVLQLAGLEGSIPGLARHADILRGKGDQEGAKRVEGSMQSARVMTILTIGEGVLHLFGLDNSILRIISGILLLVRGVVITSFLMELAKIDAKGPRVLSKAEHAREEQNRLLEGEQARTIADLRTQLEEARVSLSDATRREAAHERTCRELREQVKQAEGQEQTRRDLREHLVQAREQVQQLQALQEQTQMELQTATCNLRDLQSADRATADLQKENHALSADLQTAHLQIADLTATLERAKNTCADLQSADREPASSAKTRPAKAPAHPSDPRNITSIDEARAKHDAGGQGRAKVRHADVLSFMAANPDLKRVEVALQLGISERKVYDAIAWGKGQEHADASAQ